MATVFSPKQLLAVQTRRFAKVADAQLQVHRLAVRGGREDHAELTSGAVSTNTLRQMGHPFGRAAGAGSSTGVRGIVRGNQRLTDRAKRKGNRIRKGVLMPLPINRQTGRLRQSFFEREAGSRRSRTVDTMMGFDAPYAPYVLSPRGTRRMVARGFYSVSAGSVAGIGAIAARHRMRMKILRNLARKAQTQ